MMNAICTRRCGCRVCRPLVVLVVATSLVSLPRLADTCTQPPVACGGASFADGGKIALLRATAEGLTWETFDPTTGSTSVEAAAGDIQYLYNESNEPHPVSVSPNNDWVFCGHRKISKDGFEDLTLGDHGEAFEGIAVAFNSLGHALVLTVLRDKVLLFQEQADGTWESHPTVVERAAVNRPMTSLVLPSSGVPVSLVGRQVVTWTPEGAAVQSLVTASDPDWASDHFVTAVSGTLDADGEPVFFVMTYRHQADESYRPSPDLYRATRNAKDEWQADLILDELNGAGDVVAFNATSVVFTELTKENRTPAPKNIMVARLNQGAWVADQVTVLEGFIVRLLAVDQEPDRILAIGGWEFSAYLFERQGSSWVATELPTIGFRESYDCSGMGLPGNDDGSGAELGGCTATCPPVWAALGVLLVLVARKRRTWSICSPAG